LLFYGFWLKSHVTRPELKNFARIVQAKNVKKLRFSPTASRPELDFPKRFSTIRP
jgi:hypothetical protein